MKTVFLQTAPLLTGLLHEIISLLSKIRIPFLKLLNSRPNCLPKVTPPNTITVETGASAYEFGEKANIQYIALTVGKGFRDLKMSKTIPALKEIVVLCV